MKNINKVLLISTLLITSAVIAMGEKDKAEDKEKVEARVDKKYEHGQEAHKNHCYKCHGDDIYTRDNSFIKSIDALSKQVIRCKDGSNIPWFDEDTETVIHFVNNKFYKF